MHLVNDFVTRSTNAVRSWLGPAHRAGPPLLDRAGVVPQGQGDLADLVSQLVQARVSMPDGGLVDLLD